ncbi:MAG: hypothetical protein IPF99_27010 [Deltaproteobacteria bacterium]|nr:hypothetical protein [Deltaproteobacteria bacterium]
MPGRTRRVLRDAREAAVIGLHAPVQLTTARALVIRASPVDAVARAATPVARPLLDAMRSTLGVPRA